MPKPTKRCPIESERHARKWSPRIKAFRSKLTGNCNESTAMLMDPSGTRVTPRCVRRKQDGTKKAFNVHTDNQLTHEKHSNDMVYVSPEEKQDYRENHAPNRVAS